MTQDSQQFDFAAFFTARMKDRGLTLRKLSELSGISVQDLQNLSEGDFDHLPPAPYLRGYTMRLAKILEFDPEIWWEYFRNIGAVKMSGAEDKLPENRFAVGKTARYGWIVVAAAIVLIYGGLRFSKILGRPSLVILEPKGNPAQIFTNTVTVRGTIQNGNQVLIDDESIPVSDSGVWEKTISLEQGFNTLEIKGTKFLGKTVQEILQILYEPPLEMSSSTSVAASSTTP